jgi:hypothetical protein
VPREKPHKGPHGGNHDVQRVGGSGTRKRGGTLSQHVGVHPNLDPFEPNEFQEYRLTRVGARSHITFREPSLPGTSQSILAGCQRQADKLLR